MPYVALPATTGLLLCWRDGITMGIWLLSTIIRLTEFFSAFVVIFIIRNFNRLQLSARHYKMPAQQQAVTLPAIKKLPVDVTLLTRLQNWFLTNCDGDWEHNYGISINTLDNPGWTVKIDLVDTCLENLIFEKQIDNGNFDWLSITVTDRVYNAAGDTNKLSNILEIFLDEIIPAFANADFQYEVYVQLYGGPTKIWRPIKAIMITEDTLKINQIPDLNYNDITTMSVDDLTFKKEDIFNYKSNLSLGDNIKVVLVDTFNGVKLVAKE
jgi:Immunity protein 53